MERERATHLRASTAAALLCCAAAYVHIAYTQSHWQEWWAYGAFFLAAGAVQGALAPALVRWPRPWLLVLGTAGNLAIVGMYLLSRTAGPPLGPHAHVIEVAGPIDLATTLAEIVVVAILLALLDRRLRTVIIDALLVAGVVLWSLRLTGHLA